MAVTKNITLLLQARDRASGVLGSVGASVAGLARAGMAAAAAGAAAAVGFAGWGVKLAADYEQAQVAFEVMFGSADIAKTMLADLSQFAASTPFQMPELIDASRKLVAFGTSADQVLPSLEMIGDIAAGVGIPIGELAEIYGKAKVQGRLFAQDINQLTGRGIPIIQELAKQFGVSEGEVKKLVESGAIGFPQLERAFASMRGEGGRFSGMMQRQSQTFWGMMSTLKDNIGLVAMEIGQALLPHLKDLAAWLVKMTPTIKEWAVNMAEGIRSAAEWMHELSAQTDGLGTAMMAVLGNPMLSLEIGFLTVADYALTAFDHVSNALGNVGILVGTTMMNAFEVSRAMFFNIGTVAGNLFTGVGGILSGFFDFWRTVFGNAWQIVSNLGSNMTALFGAVFESIATRSMEPLQNLMFKGLLDGTESLAAPLQQILGDLMEGTVAPVLVDPQLNALNAPGSATLAVREMLAEAHKELEQAVHAAGQDGAGGPGSKPQGPKSKEGKGGGWFSWMNEQLATGHGMLKEWLGAGGAAGAAAASVDTRQAVDAMTIGAGFTGVAAAFANGNDPAQQQLSEMRKFNAGLERLLASSQAIEEHVGHGEVMAWRRLIL